MPKLVYQDSAGIKGSVELGSDPLLIGRANDCQIQTQDGLVSRRHARVIFDGGYWVEDNGSANGVFVGAERVQRYKLRPGDMFRCGHLEVRFELEDVNRTAVGSLSGNIAPMSAGAGQSSKAAVSDPTSALRASGTGGPPPLPANVLTGPPAAPVSLGFPDVSAGPAAPSSRSNELAHLRSELDAERQRRTDVEKERAEAERKVAESLTKVEAAQRTAAEETRKADEAVRRGEEAQRKSEEAARKAEEATRKLVETQRKAEDALRNVAERQRKADEAMRMLEEMNARGDHDAQERLQRRIEQLESELRRKGGGGGGGSSDAGRSTEQERDRLRAKVAELEAQAAARAPLAAAGADSASAARVIALEAEVRQLTDELDALEKKMTPDASKGPSDELERAKRRIEQLESEARRRPVGAVHDDKRLETHRAELESALRQLRDTERERDSLREVLARSNNATPKPSSQVVEFLTTVSDGLADIRAALRAAGDELALEHLEQVRSALRQACGQLNITL